MNTFIKFSAAPVVAAFCMFAASDPSIKDQDFAKHAADGGMAEVKLGQLAVQKAQNAKVKEFGQKMVDDHGKANEQLKEIASKKNIPLPVDVSVKERALFDRLSGLTGSAFDKTYMHEMVKDHKTDVSEFEKEATSGSDSDIKSFASTTLPTLKSHLEMANSVAASVGAK